MRTQVWVGGDQVAAEVPADPNQQAAFLDVMTFGSNAFASQASDQVPRPGTRFTGLVVPQGRLFMLKGDASAHFHVTVPVPVFVPTLLTTVRSNSRLRRVFFKYYTFPQGRGVPSALRIDRLRVFDHGAATNTQGALHEPQGDYDAGIYLGPDLGFLSGTPRTYATVDKIKEGLNAHTTNSAFVKGPIGMTLGVVNGREPMIYGGIAFVAFGIELELALPEPKGPSLQMFTR